jgi:hypothetical protein
MLSAQNGIRNKNAPGSGNLLGAFRRGNPLKRIVAQTSCGLPTQVMNDKGR